jgi:hypothetical protein
MDLPLILISDPHEMTSHGGWSFPFRLPSFTHRQDRGDVEAFPSPFALPLTYASRHLTAAFSLSSTSNLSRHGCFHLLPLLSLSLSLASSRASAPAFSTSLLPGALHVF